MKVDLLRPCSNENILGHFPVTLQRHFKELFCNGTIGLSQFTLSDITSTKQYTDSNTSYSYNYTLKIPYAGRKLSWELIFNPEDISFAPDFNFNDDTFYMSNDIEMVLANIPSLVNWNINNPQSLTSVLKEFLILYKKQQIEKLQQENIYSHLNSEYHILTEEISPNDVELLLENMCAHFLIKIKVDISTLPEYVQPMQNGDFDELLNPGDDTCILKVSFLKLDSSRINTSLQLSPRLDQVLCNTRTLHIPNYSKGTSLTDYVDLMKKLLQDHVKKVEHHYKLKKMFISCLATMHANKVVEFDAETYSSGEILSKVDGHYCLIHIELGDLFPEEKPCVSLHSPYCLLSKRICTEKVDNYLYSPRWSPEEMLRKLMSSLKESIPKFLNHEH